MNRLSLLNTNLKRIYRILPTGMQRGVWLLFFLMTAMAITELASVMALTGFFATINRPESIINSRYAKKATEIWPVVQQILNDPRQIILWASILPIGLIAAKNIFSALVAWKSSIMGERVAMHIGSSIMQRFLYMPYSWHLSAQSSRALTCMGWRFSIGGMLIQILTAYSNLITVAMLFAGLAFYEPGVTFSCVIMMASTAFLTYSLLRKRIDRAGADAASAQAKENEANMTAIGGVREIIIYQKQKRFLDAIRLYTQKCMRPRTFLNISATVPTWTLETAGFMLIWFAVFYLIKVQDAGIARITATVALIALTAWRVLPSMNRVVGATVSIRGLQGTALPCLEYFESLASETTENPPLPDPNFTIHNEIVFDHVFYRYPGAKKDALSDICCRIPVGTTLGLVGRSGAGKSTFINILSGLLEPTSGRLLVDGKPLTPEELTAYRGQVGYVPQSPYMLKGSVAENVAFRDWGQPMDEERVRQACREAAIDFLGPDCKDIDRPASGGLSGGQAQRVSIARALYTNPSLLIFDEATSALDQASENMVQEAVVQSKGKRTCVIAAHRLTTLDVCDTVLWLKDGGVFATGNAINVLRTYQEGMERTAQ